MPAAAVIPTPVAYIKVAAVKKLVVEILLRQVSFPLGYCSSGHQSAIFFTAFTCRAREQTLYLEKIRVFQAGFSPNTLAWNNRIGLETIYWFKALVMINRNSRGH